MPSALEVVQAFVHDVWSEGRLERIPELVHEDYEVEGEPAGPDFVRNNVLRFRTAFPDLRCTILTACFEEDLVAVLVRMAGTHRGIWKELPPTGRSIDIREAAFWRVRDGRIASGEFVAESVKFRIQLGLLPEGT